MKNNIILIGMPGSGKSTISKYLGWSLEKSVIDIDEFIEEALEESVGTILKKLGEEKFLDLEKEIILNLNPQNSIISCTGSIPLRKESMEYLKKLGHIILINIPLEIIKARLEAMKVDRIVGMANGRMTLDEVLAFRDSIYKENYDFIFNDDGIGNKKEMFNKFLNYFMSLPITKEMGIKINEKNYKAIYKNYNIF